MQHAVKLGMLLIVLVIGAVSAWQPRLIGDKLQVALPVAGLACALAQGHGVQYTGRYLLLELGIKGPKFGLGEAEINRRPDGGYLGFPSGHTAAASFGATALVMGCLQGNPGAQAIAIIAAGFTGASRIVSDKHTIWQVLAGATWGFVAVGLQLAAYDRGVRWVWDKGLRPAGRGLRRAVSQVWQQSRAWVTAARPVVMRGATALRVLWRRKARPVLSRAAVALRTRLDRLRGGS